VSFTQARTDTISCLTCWSHATAKLDMGDLKDDYQIMQQKMGTDYGDTISRLETLFKAAVPKDDYRDHLAEACSMTRMRYLAEHEQLDLQGFAGIIGWVSFTGTQTLTRSHDLQPKRWTAAKELLDAYELDTKCATIRDLQRTISPETKITENPQEAESEPSGLRASCRLFKKRLFRSGKGSPAASGHCK
jgi:hypothetical protein